MKAIILALAIFSVIIWHTSQAVESVKFSGKVVHVVEPTVNIGQTAPVVDLTSSDLQTVEIGGHQAKSQVIATVLSLNTPVCAAEVKHLERLAKYSPDVQFTVVTKDLPFEIRRYKRANKIKNLRIVSDFRTNTFGDLYGTRIVDTNLKGLNSRAVFVINPQGKLTYRQVVAEINMPPNYKHLKTALRKVDHQANLA